MNNPMNPSYQQQANANTAARNTGQAPQGNGQAYLAPQQGFGSNVTQTIPSQTPPSQSNNGQTAVGYTQGQSYGTNPQNNQFGYASAQYQAQQHQLAQQQAAQQHSQQSLQPNTAQTSSLNNGQQNANGFSEDVFFNYPVGNGKHLGDVFDQRMQRVLSDYVKKEIEPKINGAFEANKQVKDSLMQDRYKRIYNNYPELREALDDGQNFQNFLQNNYVRSPYIAGPLSYEISFANAFDSENPEVMTNIAREYYSKKAEYMNQPNNMVPQQQFNNVNQTIDYQNRNMGANRPIDYERPDPVMPNQQYSNQQNQTAFQPQYNANNAGRNFVGGRPSVPSNSYGAMRQLSDLDQKANALRTYLMTNNYRGEETTKKYMELQDVERRIAQLRSSQNNIR